jgi:hypothetical protein
MRQLTLILTVTACGGTPTLTPPISASAPTSVVSLEEANRLLHDDAPIDYERPIKQKPWDRSAAAQLFHDNCQAGDKAACIVEAEILPVEARASALTAIETNCRAGHLMSCRALPSDAHKLLYPDLPGAMSRRPECHRLGQPAPCDVGMLRNECMEGFSIACIIAAAVEPPLPDSDALSARGDVLSVEGCRAGIAINCVVAAGSDEDVLKSAERSCDLHREYCVDVAVFYEQRNDPLRVREAKERACEYSSGWWECISLGNDYLDHKLEEPIHGRGQALLDYGCRKAVAQSHATLALANESMCKRARLAK